jgi:hypothetical protein
MKKIYQLILFGVLVTSLFAPNASAYTAYVGIDDSLDLAAVQGFQFDVSATGTTILKYHTSSSNIGGLGQNGALPLYWDAESEVWIKNIEWYVGPTTGGYYGMDNYYEDSATPLTAGIIMSISYASEFDLDNFVLASALHPSGNYQGDWTVSEASITNGALYTFTMPSSVPIPGAIWLLGSALIGLLGIKRKFNP